MLARREAEMTLLGNVRHYNIALANEFTTRTLDSIKSHRKSAVYRALVTTFIEQLSQPAQLSGPEEIHEEVQEYIDPFREFFRNLSPPPDDEEAFEIHLLHDMCMDAVTATKEDIFVQLGVYVNLILRDLRRNPVRKKKKRSPRTPPVDETKRKKRRREFALTQLAWTRNRGKCVQSILEGELIGKQPPRAIMEPYWRSVFTEHSDSRPTMPQSENQDLSHLWSPITIEEIRQRRLVGHTAPGPDGFTTRLLRSMKDGVKVRLYNLLLWCERLPETLLRSRTVFVPKKNGAAEPGEYRPITIQSVITRELHRILAHRISSSIQVDERQRANKNFDGCRDNVIQLDMILREHRSTFRQMYMASVDVSKAFDSVSHPSIVAILKSFGIPQPLIGYISGTYEQGSTVIEGDGWTSTSIHPTRGVKQGDLLLPVIFNLITHRALQSLSGDVRVEIGDRRINASAFADDLNVFATTPGGLQSLIDTISSFL